MRTLYFDIDGTLLDRSEPKKYLAEGQFEDAARAAGFEEFVCVGNVILIIRTLEKNGIPQDGLATVWRSCRGTFRDKSWFWDSVRLVGDPDNRVSEIDLSRDWYYVDDLAERYCERAKRPQLLQNPENRLFIPEPEGDGQDIINWLSSLQATR